MFELFRIVSDTVATLISLLVSWRTMTQQLSRSVSSRLACASLCLLVVTTACDEQGGAPDPADVVEDSGPALDAVAPDIAVDVTSDATQDIETASELTIPPADWDWSRIVALQVDVSSSSIVAGGTVSAACVGLDENGIARDLSTLQPVWSWTPDDGVTPVPDVAAWNLTRAGVTELQCTALLPDGRELTGETSVDVQPGPVAALVAEAPGYVIAGEPFPASCLLADQFGNPIEPAEAQLRFSVEGAADSLDAGIWQIDRSGNYVLTCASETGIPSLAREIQVLIAPPVRMQARMLPEPVLGVYTLGQFVRSAPVFFDNFGNRAELSEIGGTFTTVFDRELAILPTGFRFEEEGRYSLVQTWTSETGQILEGTLDGIIVNSFGPDFSCVSPAEYSTVTGVDTPEIPLLIAASDSFGVAGVSASGLDATRQESGDFLVQWPSRSGFNFPIVLVVDGEERARIGYCPFTIADGEAEMADFVESLAVTLSGAGDEADLAALAATLPDVSPVNLAADWEQEFCEAGSPDSCLTVRVDSGSAIASDEPDTSLHVQDGALQTVWSARRLQFADAENVVVIDSLRVECPVDVDVTAGIVGAGSDLATCTCEADGIQTGSSIETLATVVEPLTDAACTTLASSIPSQTDAVADLFQRIDPLGSATTMRRVVNSTRFSGELQFDWQWRRENISVGESAVTLTYATRMDGPVGADVPSRGFPIWGMPPTGLAETSALWVGQSMLAQTSEALWQSRFLEGWFWSGMERLDLRNSPEIGILLPLVRVQVQQPPAWTFNNDISGFTGYDIVVTNVADLLGIDYDAAMSFNFFTRLRVVDGQWQSGAIWRDAAILETVRYPAQPVDIRAYDLAFESFDAIVRDTVYQDHLPDTPAPVLRNADGAVIAEFVIDAQNVVWNDGATRLAGAWRLVP